MNVRVALAAEPMAGVGVAAVVHWDDGPVAAVPILLGSGAGCALEVGEDV